ncbi:MAG: hypothetical protein ACOYVD_13730 [Bacillota bacterium]
MDYKKTINFYSLLLFALISILINMGFSVPKALLSNELNRLPGYTLSSILDNEGYSADAFYTEIRSIYKDRKIIIWEDYLFSKEAFIQKGLVAGIKKIDNQLELSRYEYDRITSNLSTHRVFVYNETFGDGVTGINNVSDWRPYDVILIAPRHQNELRNEDIIEVRYDEYHLILFIPEGEIPERLRSQL